MTKHILDKFKEKFEEAKERAKDNEAFKLIRGVIGKGNLNDLVDLDALMTNLKRQTALSSDGDVKDLSDDPVLEKIKAKIQLRQIKTNKDLLDALGNMERKNPGLDNEMPDPLKQAILKQAKEDKSIKPSKEKDTEDPSDEDTSTSFRP